jgi:elongation factor 1-gamma
MSSNRLYTYANNCRAFKALIASQYSRESVVVDKDFKFGETNAQQDFLKKFPFGKVPALETKDGNTLIESNAIAYYLSNDQLKGTTALDQALVIQWLSFADNEILPPTYTWVLPALGAIQPNKQAIERSKEDIKKILKFLNDHLLTRTYLVGERITLADIVVSCSLLQLYQYVLEPSVRSPYTNVNRWFTTLINQKEFKNVLGDVKLCDKAITLDNAPKKVAETSAKKEKKEKVVKQEKAVNKEAVPDLGGDEEEISLEPKTKDPFEAFPKGSWIMDDFKRFYSNNPEDKSIPYFWEKFDKENYSIWYCEYKYANELTLVFMSCNLISGMMQRLDKMRKNAFGSMILFGEDNNSTISGIWVWKGHELAFNLSPDWQVDYESYEWKKLNPDDPQTKTLVKEYFSWEGDFGGKKFNQGKIFK